MLVAFSVSSSKMAKFDLCLAMRKFFQDPLSEHSELIDELCPDQTYTEKLREAVHKYLRKAMKKKEGVG